MTTIRRIVVAQSADSCGVATALRRLAVTMQRASAAKLAFAGVDPPPPPRSGGVRAALRQGHNWRMCSIASPVRKVFLPVLLTAMSGNAAAGWVEVGGNEVTVAYADSGTIRRSGDRVKMWHLLDYANAKRIEGIKPYLSIKMQDEYDCAQERTRTLYMSLHSGNMGQGEVLGSVTDPGDWRPVPPDTLVETLRAFACGKW